MSISEPKGTPQQYLCDVTERERQIEEAVIQSMELTKKLGDEVNNALRQLLVLVKGHRQALVTRLQHLPSSEILSGYLDIQEGYSSLAKLVATISQAAFDYSLLHTLAHRFYDGPEDGSTADLAEKHLRDYTQALNAFNQVVSETVVQGQGRSGEECQCQCPACALGICLCASHSTITINEAWRDAISPESQGNLWVRPPRRGSAAEIAGLRVGDTLLAVDGQEIRTIQSLQQAIRNHKPGEQILLSVQRSSGEPQNFTVVR
jgi:hypothetical protein